MLADPAVIPVLASFIASSQFAKGNASGEMIIARDSWLDRLTFSQEIQPAQSPTHLDVGVDRAAGERK